MSGSVTASRAGVKALASRPRACYPVLVDTPIGDSSAVIAELIRRRRERVLAMRADGATMQAIADEVGLTRARVQQIIAADMRDRIKALAGRARRRAGRPAPARAGKPD